MKNKLVDKILSLVESPSYLGLDDQDVEKINRIRGEAVERFKNLKQNMNKLLKEDKCNYCEYGANGCCELKDKGFVCPLE